MAVDILGGDCGDGTRCGADTDMLDLCRGLVLDLLHQQLDTLAANLVARGRYRSERDRSAPSERVAVASGHAYLPGDRDALVDQCRNDARGQHIGQADDKIGTFVRGALGDLGTDAVAVGSGIPFAGVDDFDLDIGVQGERLMNAKDAQGELHKCCSADDDNMVRAAGDSKFGNDATLGLVVGGHVVAGLGAMDVQMDDRHGHLGQGGVPVVGCHGLNHDAGHLGAHKVAQVMVLENIVVIGVGDEQVVAVLAGLVVGAAGDLE